MRIRSLILVVCAAAAAGSCQSKQPEPAAPAVEQPPYTTTATVKDIMLHIIDPAGDMVWDSVATVIDKGGIHETAPKSDEEWFKVRSGLIMMIEGSNLLMVPGRKVARPGEKSETPGVELEPSEMDELIAKDRKAWYDRAKALHDIAQSVLEVVEKKDAQKLFDVGEDIDRACENCHRQYWYPNEKIPDLPSSQPSSAPASK
jgi:cytochrome c556